MFSARHRFIKILAFSLCIVIILCACSHEHSKTVINETALIATSTESTAQIRLTKENLTQTTQPENIEGFKSAVFYCVDTDEILFKQNTDEKISPASLTKILTACVALNYISPDTVFTVGTEINMIKPHSSLCLLNKGHRLTLKDLITGLLMASGNDAAYTIAVNSAREISNNKISDREALSYFCSLMNSFAEKIGMKSSNFTNPDGWDDENQYTTISDLIVLTKYALTVDLIRSIAGTKEKYVVFSSGENVTWKNTNQLLHPESKHYNEYACGIKTGTTNNAGNCLIAFFVKNNLSYIGIVHGCATSDERYEIMNHLFKKYTA